MLLMWFFTLKVHSQGTLLTGIVQCEICQCGKGKEGIVVFLYEYGTCQQTYWTMSTHHVLELQKLVLQILQLHKVAFHLLAKSLRQELHCFIAVITEHRVS